MKIGNAVIPCAVLEDGTRVLTQAGTLRALGRSEKPMGKNELAEPLPAFLRGKAIKPFISDELTATSKPLLFHMKNRAKAHGFKAEILPMVCDVFLAARNAGALPHNQQKIAQQCEILVRGLAKVGITALVDEATGYQEVRDREALQIILDKYLTDEWAKWTKTFPDEYYQELFRLNGIPYPPKGMNKPGYIGHWTNDIVYKRLAPGVLAALKKKNPTNESGNRPHRHHQHLTRDYGHPKLKEHLSNIIFLMKSCRTWDEFKKRLDRSATRFGDTIPLDMPE